MKFFELAELFEKLESTAGRNDMTALLAEFITAHKKSDPKELEMAAYLFTGRVAPYFVQAEYNYSEKGLITVMSDQAKSAGSQFDVVKSRSDLGDLGLVAAQLQGSVVLEKPSSLTVADVYEALWRIISTSGSGSVASKNQVVAELLRKMSPVEAKFLVRIVSGKMRLGVSTKTFLDAVSVVLSGDKSSREQLDRAYGVDPDIGWVLYNALAGKSEASKLVVGIPVHSRLVERVKEFGEVFTRLGDGAIFQPKFDGLRCQAHVGASYSADTMGDRVWVNYMSNLEAIIRNTEAPDLFAKTEENDRSVAVELFSRNLERMSDMFPEVVNELSKYIEPGTVLDGEMIGWDPDTQSFLPFQETMSRKRKHGISEAAVDVPVRYFVFDILAYKGESLVEEDTEKRLEILDRLLKALPEDSLIVPTETRMMKDSSELESFFVESVEGGLEGLIAKSKKGGYQPGARNYEWIKLKKSMDKELVDTVDVVIMGYYYGSGKKVEFGMGALLGGVYNQESGEVESVTKIGTGITDEKWREIAGRLKPLEVKEMPKNFNVAKELHPDVWVAPEVVCSVEADEVTRSKVHTAGKDQLGYGLALRFPRLIEFDRDKDMEQATSSQELAKIGGMS